MNTGNSSAVIVDGIKARRLCTAVSTLFVCVAVASSLRPSSASAEHQVSLSLSWS